MSGPDRPDVPIGAEEMERFAAFVRRAAAAYHEPPPTPRDEMWAAVSAALRGGAPAFDAPGAGEASPAEAAAPEGADPLLAAAAAGYNDPPPAPRDAMWRRIEGAWELRRSAREGDGRVRTRSGRIVPWLTGLAIAASLVIGIAIGRQSVDQLGAPAMPPVARSGETAEDAPLADARPAREGDEAAERARGVPPDAGAATPLETAPDAGTRLAAGTPGDRTPADRAPARLAPAGRPGVDADRDAAGRPSRSETALRYATLEHFGRVETLLTSFRAGEADEDDREIARWADELLAETRLLLDLSAGRDPRRTQLLEELELVLAQIAGLDTTPDVGERDLIAEGMERQGTLGRLRAVVPAGPVGYATGT